VSVHFDRALLLFQQARHDLAERELRQGLLSDPNDPRTHALLALCLSQGKKYDQATDEAQQAVALAPDLPFSHYALASVLHDRERLDEARTAVEEAIRLDPEQAGHRALLANILADQRRWREALDAADEGLRLDPEHVGCTNLRAMALTQLGRMEEAGATVEGALARDPENAVSHANLGWNLLHRREYPKALEHFREALRLNPELDWAREGMVEALKAKHWFYGLMLRYFLWMSRLGGRARWLVIVGGFIGFRLLRGVAQASPALAPLIAPILIVYAVFVFSTWLADPLFNLVLRLNRFGRLALSRDQVVASNWVGGCLLGALLALGAGLLIGPSLFVAAFVLGMLTIPVAGTFNCSPGWPRQAMGAYTALLAVVGLAGLALSAFSSFTNTLGNDAAVGLLGLFLLGVFLSGWIASILAGVRPKR
jgi:tetratricopeptide (TPR) repeat protein